MNCENLTDIQQKAYDKLSADWQTNKEIESPRNILNALVAKGIVESRYHIGCGFWEYRII